MLRILHGLGVGGVLALVLLRWDLLRDGLVLLPILCSRCVPGVGTLRRVVGGLSRRCSRSVSLRRHAGLLRADVLGAVFRGCGLDASGDAVAAGIAVVGHRDAEEGESGDEEDSGILC
jgi:hypothetical protein